MYCVSGPFTGCLRSLTRVEGKTIYPSFSWSLSVLGRIPVGRTGVFSFLVSGSDWGSCTRGSCTMEGVVSIKRFKF